MRVVLLVALACVAVDAKNNLGDVSKNKDNFVLETTGQKNYDAYHEAQLTATKSKTGNHNASVSFAHQESIKYLSSQLRNLQTVPTAGGFALCHAVRFGYEVVWFREEFPTMNVLGTDISPSIADVALSRGAQVIAWDFHKVKPEWLGAASFIYTNALDHSFDPKLALGKWLSCLTCSGVLILEWTKAHNRAQTSDVDVFEGSFETYKDLAKKAGGVIKAELGDVSRGGKPSSAAKLGYRTNNYKKKFLLVGRGNC
jgi:hypothetical protein